MSVHDTPLPQGLLDGIRAISFDAGFTLIEPWPHVGAVYARVAERFGFVLSEEILRERFHEVYRAQSDEARRLQQPAFFSSEERAREWWNGVTAGVFSGMVPEPSLKPLAEACFDEYATGKCWRVYPDVFRTLEVLRARGYRLVVLSNWDSRLQTTLDELGLSPFFERVYISSLIGLAKPRVEAFRYVAEDLRLAPQAILHVGDHPVDDLQGAIAAGMRCVLVHRPDAIAGSPPAHAAIRQLTELLFP